MASEQIESARRFYPVDERLDIAAVFRRDSVVDRLESRFADLFHADFETVDVSGTLEPTGRGMSGFIDGWREWLDSFESWSVRADGFEESGDKVLVLLDVLARSRTDRVEVPAHAANVLTFKDGRIAVVELHTDVSAARRSAGL